MGKYGMVCYVSFGLWYIALSLDCDDVKAGLLYGRIYGIAIIVKQALCRVPSLLSSILRLPL